jgi:anti-sigma-K factor RskA
VTRHLPPDFDELIDVDVPREERERLRRVHDLLVEAGPPPELSPELDSVPWPDEALQPLGLMRRSGRARRPWLRVGAVAAAVLLVGFLVGQSVGSKSTSSGFDVVHTVQMHGTAQAAAASASIEVGAPGRDGNWPMVMTVTNLPPTDSGGYYDLWLSSHGKPRALCGTFNTNGIGETVVRLTAAYDFNQGHFDGWVVTRHAGGTPERNAPVVMTT